MKHAGEKPEPPSLYSEHTISEELDRVILDCVAKNPGERIQSADQLRHQLDEAEERHPWSAEEASGWWEGHSPIPVTPPVQEKRPSGEISDEAETLVTTKLH